jgi:hypothetical protein
MSSEFLYHDTNDANMGSRNKVASHAIEYLLQNFKNSFSIAFCSTINGYKIFSYIQCSHLASSKIEPIKIGRIH